MINYLYLEVLTIINVKETRIYILVIKLVNITSHTSLS